MTGLAPMLMTPSVRKLTLTAHVTTSVGWLGALVVFLAHALASLISRDEQVVRPCRSRWA